MVSTVDSGHDHRKLGSLHKAHQLESTQTVLLDQAQFPGGSRSDDAGGMEGACRRADRHCETVASPVAD